MGKKKNNANYEVDDGISPSSYEFWEDFYDHGEGSGEVYEWYVDFKNIQESLMKLVKNNDKLLHIGCGNSLLAEDLVEEVGQDVNLSILNVDVCQNAIDRMIERNSTLPARMKNSLSYQVMDATQTGLGDASIQGVIDKGTCDALLSTLEIECGENEMVAKLLHEMYRVLVPGGFMLVVSRNTCLEPYFYSTDDEWQLTKTDIVTSSKKGKNITQLNYLYLAIRPQSS